MTVVLQFSVHLVDLLSILLRCNGFLKFKGNSIVVEGSVQKIGHSNDDYVASVSAYIDGEKVEDFLMPFDYITRKYEIFSKYCIESGEHTLRLVVNNPHRDFVLNATNMVIYDNE